MKNRLITLLLGLLFCMPPVFAQNDENYALHIRKCAETITLDGILDEALWQNAQEIGDFNRQFPQDTGMSKFPTRVRMCFDDKNIYIAAECFQDEKTITVQSLKRDFSNGTTDVLNIVMDPYKDGLNGFFFGINPYNVQREALIDNGTNLSFEWDNRWNSAVHISADRWTVEIAIPFRTLRYKVAEGPNSWHINFVRLQLQTWEVSTWRPVPRQYVANNLAFTGNLIWDEAPPKPGLNVSLIPYATANYAVDYPRDLQTQQTGEAQGSFHRSIGGDAKIGLGPALSLDLTINPDFSQVEVDRQVTNLSRFELFFPERRQFFLENRDLFAMFGFPQTRPFFSRRIGLAYNPLTGANETVPILAGARLSGKLNDNWRIGALNMQTKQVQWDSAHALPAANFSVATVQRKVLGRSAISAIYVDKENFLDKLNDSQKGGYQAWQRVAGVEFNLYSKDNKWEGEWYYHRSLSPDPGKRGASLASFLAYRDRKFNVRGGYLRTDSTYTADVGFVPRPGVQNMFAGYDYNFYPSYGPINSWNVGIDLNTTLDLHNLETDREINPSINATFQNQSYITLSLNHNYTYLFEPFDPTNLYADGASPLPGMQGYTYNGFYGEYGSSTSNKLQFNTDAYIGQYFNGSGAAINANLAYRLQPLGLFTISANYTHIKLPEPYASADFWLIGPRAELAFSRKFFASAFFQYNTQVNNFNINARLQWRFAPVSDIFLVYTDNSFAEIIPNTPVRFLTPKNRTLVLKAVYWW